MWTQPHSYSVELDDNTYSCSSRGGAKVGGTEFVRKQCQNIGPLAFPAAVQLKHRWNKYYKQKFLNIETQNNQDNKVVLKGYITASELISSEMIYFCLWRISSFLLIFFLWNCVFSAQGQHQFLSLDSKNNN